VGLPLSVKSGHHSSKHNDLFKEVKRPMAPASQDASRDSVDRLWYSSPAIAFLAPRRIYSAARLDEPRDSLKSGAVAARTSLLSRICGQLFHPKFTPCLNHDVASDAPLIAVNLTGPMSHVQRANALTARADDPAELLSRSAAR
jgi:hypothetical protein